jgi:hypothetical protein
MISSGVASMTISRESVTAMLGHIAGDAPAETTVVEARTGPDVEV